MFLQTDVFSVEAVSLGTVQRVVIGHDDITPGNGWHLKKVVVRDPTRHGQEWEFMCNRSVHFTVALWC